MRPTTPVTIHPRALTPRGITAPTADRAFHERPGGSRQVWHRLAADRWALAGGAVVIEMIFNIQGMGQLIFQGVTRNDVNIVQGVSITVALAFIIINIVVDMLYVLVNPRIRSV